LQLFKIVPDDFVGAVRLALRSLATFVKHLLPFLGAAVVLVCHYLSKKTTWQVNRYFDVLRKQSFPTSYSPMPSIDSCITNRYLYNHFVLVLLM
jgi:hypothetical protein